jgi:hypothetical protein
MLLCLATAFSVTKSAPAIAASGRRELAGHSSMR